MQSGDDLTFTWTMDGDVTDDVYLSLNSGWGAQYYFSSVVDNDGSHTITLPTNMNPNEDYTVYIESASNGQRTTCAGSTAPLTSSKTMRAWCWTTSSMTSSTQQMSAKDFHVVRQGEPAQLERHMDDRPRWRRWSRAYSQWGSEGWGDRKLEYCQRFWPDTVEIRASALKKSSSTPAATRTRT